MTRSLMLLDGTIFLDVCYHLKNNSSSYVPLTMFQAIFKVLTYINCLLTSSL